MTTDRFYFSQPNCQQEANSMKIVSVETIRHIEADANETAIPYAEMMENAGRAVALRVMGYLQSLRIKTEMRVTILVGSGNNGGDGLVAGRIIAAESNALVRCYLLKKRSDEDPIYQQVKTAGIFIANAEDDQRFRVLTHNVASADIIIDALFGIGARLPLSPDAKDLLRAVKAALTLEETPPTYIRTTHPLTRSFPKHTIFAVDCPSGLDCDTGMIDEDALTADETITFIGVKPGLLLFPGAQAVGTLTVASAGIPPTLSKLKSAPDQLIDETMIRPLLPSRAQNSNKGTFGRVLIIGGSLAFSGAPGLSAIAAYRTGAGVVTVVAPQQVITALASKMLEVTWLPTKDQAALSQKSLEPILQELPKVQAVVLGPGLGQDDETAQFVIELLRWIPFLPAEHPPAFVIDADALNILAKTENFWDLLPPQTVLTPHPGEMARLTGLSIPEIQANRWQMAREYAAKWNTVVLLKGAHTVITGANKGASVLPFKNSALATAGTGDILAGMIAALLAEGMMPYEAACTGGYLHGLAGEDVGHREGSPRAVIASDVLQTIGKAILQIEAG